MSRMGPLQPIKTVLLPRLSVNDLLWVANTRHGPAGHWHARVREDSADHDHLRDVDGGTAYLAAHHVAVPAGRPGPAARDALAGIRESVRDLVGPAAPEPSRTVTRIVERARFRIEPASPGSAGRLISSREGWAGFVDDLVPPFLELLRRRDRLGICGNPLCRLVYLDVSRAGSRRWCDTGGCGNRVRVARHRRAALTRTRDTPFARTVEEPDVSA